MANEVIEIFGVTSPKNIKSWEEKFDCVSDNDENALYVSKEEFVSEGDPDIKDFHYRYAVECFSMWENEKCQWYYSLQLVVLPEYLDKKYLEGVASCSGIDTDEVNVTVTKKGAIEGDVYGGTFGGNGKGVSIDISDYIDMLNHSEV